MSEYSNYFKCPKCISTEIEELTKGIRVAKVVGVTLDNGLVTDLVTFIPNDDAVFYRCKKCHTVLNFDTKGLVEFLRRD
ncbi:hypothetical protein LCGC14_2078380 [marine sediment metagenome]|uniref:Uncharacterized protein n=1 Tax=marine sediment metagenome TaxID=412755 RepID=A0A0F9EGJ1_9ZZZZ